MLAMPAFHNVAAVALIGTLEVQKADAETESPTQVSGSCRLSGIRLSEFLEPQQAAFRSAMAAGSGATEGQVVIKDVSDNSARRHLRRRRLLSGGDLLVKFAIVVERDADSATSPPSAAAQSLSSPAITAHHTRQRVRRDASVYSRRRDHVHETARQRGTRRDRQRSKKR